MKTDYDVVAIGHLDKGRIVRGSESHEAVGGAVYYGGAVLARLGLKVAVVTRLAKEDAWMLEELHSFGIEVFPVWTPETTGIENYHPDPDSDFRICRPLGFAGTFREEDLPDVEARLFYVGTIAEDHDAVSPHRSLPRPQRHPFSITAPSASWSFWRNAGR